MTKLYIFSNILSILGEWKQFYVCQILKQKNGYHSNKKNEEPENKINIFIRI